jgi:hypothetical protein
MFFGRFSTNNWTKLREALSAMRPTFGRVYAADNAITFEPSSGILADDAFTATMPLRAQTAQEKSLAWRAGNVPGLRLTERKADV